MKKSTNPILITGAPRSGSTFIARILEMCGANVGLCSVMRENIELTDLTNLLLKDIKFPVIAKNEVVDSLSNTFTNNVHNSLRKQHLLQRDWIFKSSLLSLTWKYWHITYPEARWVVVRRIPKHVAHSCIKTTYMKLMKTPEHLKAIGVETEEQGWMWLIHKYEEQWIKMYQSKLNIFEVYPDRMEDNDYSRIKKLVEELGLTWNPEVIPTMSKYFLKQEGGN